LAKLINALEIQSLREEALLLAHQALVYMEVKPKSLEVSNIVAQAIALSLDDPIAPVRRHPW
jgi:hypothetical protein